MVAVDYRLAPEDAFPAAADDALAAFRHVAEHASELGVDEAAIAVGGDSAGGNLAAVTALAAHADAGPEPRFQVLIYPVTDLSEKRRSYRLFSDGFLLTERQMDWYRDHYVPDPAERSDPRVSPLLAEDLAGVAPAYVTTAGFDPLRDEGEAYAARLRAAGVPVALRRHPGLVHGFANVVGVGSVGREALREICGALAVGLRLIRATCATCSRRARRVDLEQAVAVAAGGPDASRGRAASRRRRPAGRGRTAARRRG